MSTLSDESKPPDPFIDIASGDRDKIIQAAIALRSSDHPDADSALLRLLEQAGKDAEVKVVAARMLAERDPDRDPSYLVRYVLGTDITADTDFRASFGKLGDLGLAGSGDGSARLRQLDPVRRYARMLDAKRWVGTRIAATISLGDTADLAALDPLCTALTDRRASVRAEAANAVRRLHYSGAAEALRTHRIRDLLIDHLSDRHQKVRFAAARALAITDNLDAVKEHRKKAKKRDRAELDRILHGEILPLQKMWAGDTNL